MKRSILKNLMTLATVLAVGTGWTCNLLAQENPRCLVKASCTTDEGNEVSATIVPDSVYTATAEKLASCRKAVLDERKETDTAREDTAKANSQLAVCRGELRGEQRHNSLLISEVKLTNQQLGKERAYSSRWWIAGGAFVLGMLAGGFVVAKVTN